MKSPSGFINEGSKNAPQMRVFLNADTLVGLRRDSVWHRDRSGSVGERLVQDGFDGIQLTTEDPVEEDGQLPHCGLGRVNHADEVETIFRKLALRGDLCLTLHAGWGIEDDDTVFRLVEAILKASERHGLPVFLETHRATITQDIWRTVQIAKRFPEIRFNGDFSHYYCGQELVYGDWEEKLAFMAPIFDRVGFLHGRIASPGCMQVPIGPDLGARPMQAHGQIDYLAHFKQLWTRAMQGFLRRAQPGDVLIFAPELLPGNHYYARLFPDASGELVEESDRYQQAVLYKDLAAACFAEARSLAVAE